MTNPFEQIIERLEQLTTLLSQPQEAHHQPEAQIIDRAELCKRLRITEPTVIRWEKRGKIPRIAIGSSVRYNWPKVIEALEKCK